MAIIRISPPSSSPVAVTDYQAQNNQTSELIRSMIMVDPILGESIIQGAVFNVGGVLYRADSDTLISGSASPPSPYVRIIPSTDGLTCLAEYSINLAGITWNRVHNGYYDAAGNLFIFKESDAIRLGTLPSSLTFIGKEINTEVIARKAGDAEVNAARIASVDSEAALRVSGDAAEAAARVASINATIAAEAARIRRAEFGSGTGNFTVPAGVVRLFVTAAACGGDGGYGGPGSINTVGGGGGAGGGGGQFTIREQVSVAPGQAIAYQVSNRQTRGATVFGAIVLDPGITGGNGSTLGRVQYIGGAGGSGNQRADGQDGHSGQTVYAPVIDNLGGRGGFGGGGIASGGGGGGRCGFDSSTFAELSGGAGKNASYPGCGGGGGGGGYGEGIGGVPGAGKDGIIIVEW